VDHNISINHSITRNIRLVGLKIADKIRKG